MAMSTIRSSEMTKTKICVYVQKGKLSQYAEWKFAFVNLYLMLLLLLPKWNNVISAGTMLTATDCIAIMTMLHGYENTFVA